MTQLIVERKLQLTTTWHLEFLSKMELLKEKKKKKDALKKQLEPF